eukprot:EG_transcript_15295
MPADSPSPDGVGAEAPAATPASEGPSVDPNQEAPDQQASVSPENPSPTAASPAQRVVEETPGEDAVSGHPETPALVVIPEPEGSPVAPLPPVPRLGDAHPAINIDDLPSVVHDEHPTEHVPCCGTSDTYTRLMEEDREEGMCGTRRVPESLHAGRLASLPGAVADPCDTSVDLDLSRSGTTTTLPAQSPEVRSPMVGHRRPASPEGCKPMQVHELVLKEMERGDQESALRVCDAWLEELHRMPEASFLTTQDYKDACLFKASILLNVQRYDECESFCEDLLVLHPPFDGLVRPVLAQAREQLILARRRAEAAEPPPDRPLTAAAAPGGALCSSVCVVS